MQSRNPDGTVTLTLERLNAQGWSGTGPLTFTWYRGSDHVAIGNGTKITVGPHSTTASYYVIASNQCGSPARSDVRIEVPLPIASSGLVANKIGATQIRVTWPASSGAARYVVERRYDGNKWEWLGETTGTSYDDGGLALNMTYAYRVYALDGNSQSKSAYSNADVASTTTFAAVGSGTPVLASTSSEVLRAINLVRAVSGWPALTWASMISSTHPLPVPGGPIPALHLMTCRARMNEALQSLGARLANYTDADLSNKSMTATHVNELLERAQ